MDVGCRVVEIRQRFHVLLHQQLRVHAVLPRAPAELLFHQELGGELQVVVERQHRYLGPLPLQHCQFLWLGHHLPDIFRVEDLVRAPGPDMLLVPLRWGEVEAEDLVVLVYLLPQISLQEDAAVSHQRARAIPPPAPFGRVVAWKEVQNPVSGNESRRLPGHPAVLVRPGEAFVFPHPASHRRGALAPAKGPRLFFAQDGRAGCIVQVHLVEDAVHVGTLLSFAPFVEPVRDWLRALAFICLLALLPPPPGGGAPRLRPPLLPFFPAPHGCRCAGRTLPPAVRGRLLLRAATALPFLPPPPPLRSREGRLLRSLPLRRLPRLGPSRLCCVRWVRAEVHAEHIFIPELVPGEGARHVVHRGDRLDPALRGCRRPGPGRRQSLT